jgi:hypothetical protein
VLFDEFGEIYDFEVTFASGAGFLDCGALRQPKRSHQGRNDHGDRGRKEKMPRKMKPAKDWKCYYFFLFFFASFEVPLGA